MALLKPRKARATRHLAALIASGLLLAGCGAGATSQNAAPSGNGGPTVVAASSWEAAFAKAAGAGKVTVIVPPSIQHAPDYDPKPSDLAAVSGANYVLYAPFEGFAGKIKDAAGSSAKLVQLNLDNAKDNVESEVRRLAGMFGTQAAAETWIKNFDTEYNQLSTQVRAAWPGGQPPRVIAQAFVGYAAQLSGAQVLGTYGPDPVTASQLAELAAKNPQYVLDNVHMSTGAVLPGSPARQIGITNYPGPDLDLLPVYRANANTLINAFRQP
jgi:zinc transport system substrate-binding protein